MKTVLENAEKELFQAISSIHKDPESWAGWFCLHIDMSKAPGHKDMAQVKSNIAHAISNLMAGCKGNIYICCYSEIYVFASEVTKLFLEDTGEAISNLVEEMTKTPSTYSIWNLKDDGHRFVQIQMDAKQTSGALLDPCVSCEGASDRNGNPNLPRVLLVEDDPVTRWLVRNALKGRCVLTTASTAGVAIDSYQKSPSDLVFLDIGLPDKNGGTVLQHIMHQDPKACVVIFSGQSDMDNIVSMIERGAAGFISKPFTQDRLLHYLSECQVVR